MPDRKIAVIAVHGVGHHEPGESAHAIADLLGNPPLGTNPDASYCPFTESRLRLPAKPLETADPPQPDQDVGYQFMRNQLRNYQSTPPEDIYDTVELKSRRTGPRNQTAHVDIYELFWSDLSHLGTGFLRVFGELYQILFHLARLGAHTVSAAFQVLSETHPKTASAWRRYDAIQNFTSLILTVAIPISNLLLLPLLLIPVGADWQSRCSDPLRGIITSVFIGLALLSAVYAGLTWIKDRRPQSLRPALWLALPVNAALLWVAYLAFSWPLDGLLKGSMTVAYLAAALLVYLIVANYARYRPEIRGWCALLSAVLTAAPLAAVLFAPGPEADIQWTLRCAELAYWLIALSWLVFYLFFLLAYLLGLLALSAARGIGPSPRRTEWTARLTLALPATLFMLVTVGIWWALLTVLNPLLSGMQYTLLTTETSRRLSDCITDLFLSGTVRMYPTMVVLLLAGVFLAVMGLAPVILADVKPPRGPGTQKATEGMGIWLSTGFTLMRGSGELIYLSMALTALLGVVIAVSTFTGSDPTANIPWLQRDAATTILKWIGGIFGGSAVTLLAFRGKLDKVASGFRTVLNVALDVDNYIRDDPDTATPRARICARFASLLRHIAGQPYDKIVIIAHSQGTVITADLLRFLLLDQTALSRSLNTLRNRPIELFTMGSPLGQLYGLRFPYLYDWARDDAAPSAAATAEALGVRRWINAYRSGDYVGRSLWSSFDPAIQFELERRQIDTRRAEECIGQGAHTHYWDSHGAEIALILDELIG